MVVTAMIRHAEAYARELLIHDFGIDAARVDAVLPMPLAVKAVGSRQ